MSLPHTGHKTERISQVVKQLQANVLSLELKMSKFTPIFQNSLQNLRDSELNSPATKLLAQFEWGIACFKRELHIGLEADTTLTGRQFR